MNPKPLTIPADAEAVKAQVLSRWIGPGDVCRRLERRMAEWVGVSHAQVFGSGTAALSVAFKNLPGSVFCVPYLDGCPTFERAAKWGGGMVTYPPGPLDVSIYPDSSGLVVDYARCLPMPYSAILHGMFGVFSFGALKDVTGGIGGCLVSRRPFRTFDMEFISPLSDINAALIMNQLDRYDGHATHRLVADDVVWEAPSV